MRNTLRNCGIALNWCQNALLQLSFGLKFAPCVKKLKVVQKRARNCKFIWIGFLGQKHTDILKFPIFVQNGVRNYESINIILFCQKHEEIKQPDKKFLPLDLKIERKKAAQL